MPQGSLLTWLSKPASVTEPPRGQPAIAQRPLQPRPRPPITRDSNPATPHQQDQPNQGIDISNGQNRPPLHPNVTLRPCTKADIPAFKSINALLLQIPYAESFYREIISDQVINNLTLLAFWNDDQNPSSTFNGQPTSSGRLIGAVRCRVLAQTPASSPPTRPSGIATEAAQDSPKKTTKSKGPMLYLSTLVLLSPYRGHGVASAMVDEVVRRAVRAHGVTSVGAHVWEANGEGLQWYAKRGFKVEGKVEGYYRRLNPQTAVVVSREIGLGDVLGGTRAGPVV